MKKYKKIFSGLGLLSITTLMGASIVACSPKEEKPKQGLKTPQTGQDNSGTKTEKGIEDAGNSKTKSKEVMDVLAKKHSLSIKASKNDEITIALNFDDKAYQPKAELYKLNIEVVDKFGSSEADKKTKSELVSGKKGSIANEVVFTLKLEKKDKPYQRILVQVSKLSYDNNLISESKIEIENGQNITLN
ncbi:hypothetical protein RRG48_06640 [Mycoplasmopsis canis]|uniref:hypothetical protein n=1 Tax=Mycoplasmopsis cynos TaxID=171284 RepID=UPI002AFE2C06|nr:hypothetical protein [Mycoplasmopsis cynos]WQQ13529.1 hypothetical protein RRG58_03690 [Mycoplasmopsis cynos]WQQ14326.1 hypothetical protein RRG52_01225 [Mycoplasmopsis cynos]